MSNRQPLTYRESSTGGTLADPDILRIQDDTQTPEWEPSAAPNMEELLAAQNIEKSGIIDNQGRGIKLPPEALKRLNAVQLATLLVLSGILACGEILPDNKNEGISQGSSLSAGSQIENIRGQLAKIGLEEAVTDNETKTEELQKLLNPLSFSYIRGENGPWIINGFPHEGAGEIEVDVMFSGEIVENHIITEEEQNPVALTITPRGDERPKLIFKIQGTEVFVL